MHVQGQIQDLNKVESNFGLHARKQGKKGKGPGASSIGTSVTKLFGPKAYIVGQQWDPDSPWAAAYMSKV